MEIALISGLLVFIVILAMIFLGIHIGIALGIIGFAGIWFFRGYAPALASLAFIPYEQIANYEISILPLFLLMGEFAVVAGLAEGLFDAARAWFGRLRGSLTLTVVAMCTALAACTGSALASCAAVTRTALPPMVEHGYDKAKAAGAIAASGTLAVLIPPSIILVFYSIMTEVSMGKLLIAGFIPGIWSALLYAVLILFMGWRNPQAMPAGVSRPIREKIKVAPRVWPVFLIVTLIIGGLYGGVFTPTEVGGVGALLTLGLAIAHTRGKWHPIWGGAWAAARESAVILLLLIGATILVRCLTLTGMTSAITEFIVGLEASRWIKLVAILLMYGILGCFITAIPYFALTLPFVFPIVTALGFNGIWFGIIITKMVEIGAITPPFGLTVYAVGTMVPEVKIEQIFKNVLPFLVVDIITVATLCVFPQIILFLPSRMAF